MSKATEQQAYFVGGGIASLAGAAFLIRDGGFRGDQITILEESAVMGGGLDGSGNSQKGYVSRGGRMFEEHYVCIFDLLNSIPSLDHAHVSAGQDILDFNEQVISDARSRLMKNGVHLDVTSYGLTLRHQWDILRMLIWRRGQTEIKIEDWFTPSFFETPFWFLWTTSFSFQPWHNVDELRRYFLRFIHLFPGFDRYEGILRTRYNQYDSMILPLVNWLKGKGVRFETGSRVTDVQFSGDASGRRAEQITLIRKGRSAKENIRLGESDLAFITLGSMVEASTRGSMKTPPPPHRPAEDGAWDLWKRIAKQGDEFGNPATFCSDIPATKWVSFTCTQKSSVFFRYMQELTTNEAGTGGLVTLTDSSWLLSVVLFHQPFFPGQPDDECVFWGYGLFPDRPGDFVKKKMHECTGAEILTEVFAHLRVPDMQAVMQSSDCIPTLMPYITAQFMTRRPLDRPAVIPQGAKNFAFLGQFCEIEDDVVFTVEYSVRAALMAVSSLLGLPGKVPPVYKGQYNPMVMLRALLAMWR